MFQSTTFQNSPLKVNIQTANSLNFHSTQQGNWKMPKENENTQAINTQEPNVLTRIINKKHMEDKSEETKLDRYVYIYIYVLVVGRYRR